MINLLSFIPIIIYTISPSITNSLGTVVAQPLLHLTVPHGSHSSIAKPIPYFFNGVADVSSNTVCGIGHLVSLFLSYLMQLGILDLVH